MGQVELQSYPPLPEEDTRMHVLNTAVIHDGRCTLFSHSTMECKNSLSEQVCSNFEWLDIITRQ